LRDPGVPFGEARSLPALLLPIMTRRRFEGARNIPGALIFCDDHVFAMIVTIARGDAARAARRMGLSRHAAASQSLILHKKTAAVAAARP